MVEIIRLDFQCGILDYQSMVTSMDEKEIKAQIKALEQEEKAFLSSAKTLRAVYDQKHLITAILRTLGEVKIQKVSK